MIFRRIALDKQGQRTYKLGRQSTCDIQIEHQSASRQHAVIGHHKEGYLCIVDPASANGTTLDGKELPRGQPTKLSHGATIKFGDCPVEYMVELLDRRTAAKKDVMSQLAGYADDDFGEVCLSVCLSFCWSFYRSVRLSIGLSVCLSVCLPVCRSVLLSLS